MADEDAIAETVERAHPDFLIIGLDYSEERPKICDVLLDRFPHMRCVMVTGAGGSIGSELAYQLVQLKPKQLVLLDKDENGLHETCLRLQGKDPCLIAPVVADIRFAERLRAVFTALQPELIFHAAAHKHVHLMEANPCEAIANNVLGTRNLVELAIRFRLSRFVQISTDKAVRPTSIMGASKRVCEMIVQSQARQAPTRFCCVRFGNVLGSRGSVLPIFQEQIRHGGPLVVTHPEAQRFLYDHSRSRISADSGWDAGECRGDSSAGHGQTGVHWELGTRFDRIIRAAPWKGRTDPHNPTASGEKTGGRATRS